MLCKSQENQKKEQDMNFTSTLYAWQALVGAIIGASAPFLLWWFTEIRQESKKKKNYLYYLERTVVDQINLIVEAEHTINQFCTEKLETVLSNIKSNPHDAYSIDSVFFPLFSVRALPADINLKSSGSGYIDNKIGQIYSMSADMPHIINDARLQLRETIDINKQIAFSKLNSPMVQKEHYKLNIGEYKKMIQEDILKKNLPLYLKKLVETLIAIREKNRISSITWKLKHDPRWKFYKEKSRYIKAKIQITEKMDKYFAEKVKNQLQIIEKSKI